MRYFLRCLLAACLTLGMSMSAHAELDENGIEPKHWYKFNGNLDSSGATALSIDGEKGASYVDSGKGVQAYQFKSAGPCQPYGSGIKRGNGNFTVVTVAKSCDRNHGIIWTQGGKGTGRGFGLVSVGASQIALRVFGSTWSSSGTDLIVANVSDATTDYHVYSLIYTDANRTFTLYVDDATVPAGSGQVSDSATEGTFPDTHFQWGSLFQGLNYSMTQGYDACLDDFRLYQQALTTDQIKKIVASFRTTSFVWGTAGKAGNGVSTANDGAFHRDSWTFNFSKATTGIVHDEIDLTKHVSVTKIRLMQRADKGYKPSTATLTQGANTMTATSVTSHDDDATGMTLYGSTGSAVLTRGYHEIIFDGSVEFDPTADIQLGFNTSTGCSVTQPANSPMGNGTWSPVIEITGSYYVSEADYQATIGGDKRFSKIDTWDPKRPTSFEADDVLKITNTDTATLTLDEDLAVATIKFANDAGHPLKLVFDATKTIQVKTLNFTGAAGGATIDLSGLDGKELAGNAVCGAPYSYWVTTANLVGSYTMSLPTMPQGYSVSSQYVTGYGLRLVVTAHRQAKFGSVNLNLYNGDGNKVGGTTTEHGVFGVVGTSWNDLAANSRTGTLTKYVQDGKVKTGSIGFTKSDGNQWSCNYTYDAIFTGYADDGGNPVITLSNIPFDTYRVIVYRSTDNDGGKTFTEARIGTSQADAVSYFGPTAGDTTGGVTIGFGTADHNWGKSSWISGFTEGVNYIVSGVLTGGSAYIASRGANQAGSRGCVSAIQIVEVGQYKEEEMVSTHFETEDAPPKAYEAVVTATTAFGNLSRYSQTWQERPAQVIELTGTGGTDVMVFGGTGFNEGGTLNKDIWFEVMGGTYNAIFGGSNSDNWSGSSSHNIDGRICVEVGGNTVANHLLGGNYKDGHGVTISGDIDVVVKDEAVVKGLIAGGGISTHASTTTFGSEANPVNLCVRVLNVQGDNSSGTLVGGDSSDYIVGGGVYAYNVRGWQKVFGNTTVSVEIPAGASGNFAKYIVGGGLVAGGDSSGGTSVSGNAAVIIDAPTDVCFTNSIYAGARNIATGSSTVAGNATLTLKGGTFTSPVISGGLADGTHTLEIAGNITLDLGVTAVSGFDALVLAAGKTLKIKATKDADFSFASVSGTGTLAKEGSGTVRVGAIAGGDLSVSVSAGTLVVTLTSGQIGQAEVKCFKSSQAEAVIGPRLSFVNAEGEPIPGSVSKKADGYVYFTPSVEHYVRTVASGATVDWNDSGWTKNGVPNQPYDPAPGKMAAVDVTLSGDATLDTTMSPKQLASLNFLLAEGVEGATLKVRHTPSVPPTDPASNMTYEVFCVMPRAVEGVTVEYVLGLDASKYASEFHETTCSFLVTKRTEHGTISIKIGARTENVVSSITSDMEGVGAYPLSGLLWRNAKVYNNNNTPYTDFLYFADNDGSGRQIRYVFRGPNTYFNGPGKGNPCDTPNAVLTSSYVDDGDVSAETTWTVTNPTNEAEQVTLPAAPNARGWQIHLDGISYKAYDVYFITASDQNADILKETPIYLSANGGQTWVPYCGDPENHTTRLGSDNWKGLPFETGVLTEGLSYLKMRVSKAILGTADVSALEITHGKRTTSYTDPIRSGLCAIQVVELTSDGAFSLAENGNWTTDAIWDTTLGREKWKSGNESVATIVATGRVTRVNVDDDVLAKTVALSGTNDFTLAGEHTITTVSGFDANNYAHVLSLEAPVVGVMQFSTAGRIRFAVGEGQERTPYDYDIKGAPTVLKDDAGTLVYDFTPQSDYLFDISKGIVRFENAVPNGAVTIQPNGTLVFHVEAGQTITNTVAFLGAGPIVKTGAGTLALRQNAPNYSGSFEVREGTVRLMTSNALGTGTTTVHSGATLDICGCKPLNKIVISGSGVGGAGAFVNTGTTAVSYVSTLVLDDDAVLGGTANIGFAQSATPAIDFAGHTLTVSGADGFTLSLYGFTIGSTGKLSVKSGSVASMGSTSMKRVDIEILPNGVLNLSAGTFISCSNFVSAVEEPITGTKAELDVYGILNASSPVSIPRLRLEDTSVLKGVGLCVVSNLTLGATLHVDVDRSVSAGGSFKVATIPIGQRITSPTVIVKGHESEGFFMKIQNQTELWVVREGVMTADVTLQDVIAGTNFEQLVISGLVDNFQGGAPRGETNLNIVVTFGDGTVTTQRFAYVVRGDGRFHYVIGNLSSGEHYGVYAYLTIEGASISAVSPDVNAMTARTLSQWIDEDYRTFGGKRIGTGHWDDLSGIASVKGEAIAFAAKAGDQQLSFTSTNRAQIAEMGAQKEIRISEMFTAAAIPPALPSSEGLVAVAMTTNALGQCQFAVATNGGWQVTARTTFAPELNTAYEIVVRIDESAGTIDYGVVKDKAIVWLGDGAYLPNRGCVQIVFTGAGKITKIDGQCHDANLARVTTGGVSLEYATVDEAIRAAGEDSAIEPLWWSNYRVTDERGSFRVAGKKDLFEPIFAKWYHYEKTPGDVEDSYRYVAANNWIEYSDKSGVEQAANGAYCVTNEQGLAWIAEQAANGEFTGDVTLGADLDLASKNWTPIANFTGSFDGQGRVIAGLNNTNVVIDPLLGEAGHYYGGVTNAWNYTAYGLFGCTKDAAFRNITLRDVAISNTADSVAALVGVHALGDLTVENVTNASGVVRGEGNVVAGLVTIGGEGGDIGNVVVKGNTNSVEIVGREDANVAQILAGTTADTKFMGTVDATGNGGQEVPVSFYLNMPICNFAAAIERYDEQTNYWRYVEANDEDSVPIDPVNRTARMLAGYFDNGTINYLGRITDLITASENGAEIVVPNATTNDCWSTVLVDRNITLDLGGTCIYGVYDCDLFTVTNGAKLIVGNGELVKVEGYEYYRVATGSSVEETQPLTKGENGGTFYDRTVGVKTFGVVADKATIVVPYTSPDFLYTVQHVSTLAEEWQNVEEYTDVLGSGGEMRFELDASEDSGFYRVKMVPSWYQPEE